MAVTLRYFTEFGKPALQKTICGGIYAKVYCILVRIQCRRKESSRSLSHLLVSFLLSYVLRVTTKRKVVNFFEEGSAALRQNSGYPYAVTRSVSATRYLATSRNKLHAVMQSIKVKSVCTSYIYPVHSAVKLYNMRRKTCVFPSIFQLSMSKVKVIRH